MQWHNSQLLKLSNIKKNSRDLSRKKINKGKEQVPLIYSRTWLSEIKLKQFLNKSAYKVSFVKTLKISNFSGLVPGTKKTDDMKRSNCCGSCRLTIIVCMDQKQLKETVFLPSPHSPSPHWLRQTFYLLQREKKADIGKAFILTYRK
jgi:hypothetical protein